MGMQKASPRTVAVPPPRARDRLGIVFALGVIAFAIMIVGLRSYEILDYRREEIRQSEAEVVSLVDVLERYVSQATTLLNYHTNPVVNAVRQSSGLDDPKLAWDRLLRAGTDALILDLDVLDPKGNVVRSSNPRLLGGIYKDQALLSRSAVTDGTIYGNPSFCSDCPNPYVVNSARRLRNSEGQTVGVLVLRTNPANLQRLAGTLGSSFGGNGRILTENGTVLVNEPQGTTGGTTPADDGLLPIDRLDKSGRTVVLPWDHNPDSLVAYKFLPGHGLFAMFARSKSAILADWQGALRQSIYSSIVILIVCGGGAGAFMRMLLLRARAEERVSSRSAELESIQSSARISGLRWYPEYDNLVPTTGTLDVLGLRRGGGSYKVKDLIANFANEEAQALWDALRDCAATGAEHRIELTVKKGPGQLSSPTYAFTTFRHEGSSPGKPQSGHHVFVVCQDITEWQETRTQHAHLLKMDAVGQITGGVAHDFNNLLVIILGNIEAISEEFPEDDPRHALLEVTLGAALQARQLTTRLLAFARKQPLQPTSVDVTALVENMRSLLKRTIGEHVVLAFDQEPGMRPWNVKADRSQLEFAILNLVINARDALGPGGNITIRVRNRVVDSAGLVGQDDLEPGEYVDIMVEDNGSGMSEEVASRAIEPYFTTKAPGAGSGLGLSQVYGFVKQSGGHFRIHSEEGKGTLIHLYLPRARATDEAAVHYDHDGGFEFGHETILVVEDDEAVRAHIDRVLTILGYKVLSRIDGPSALKLVEEGVAFDLLLTDVMLPGGLSGVQIAQKVKQMRPGMPVLYVSGYAKDMIDAAGRTTADIHFLQKPFLRGELGRKVKTALESSEVGLEVGRGPRNLF